MGLFGIDIKDVCICGIIGTPKCVRTCNERKAIEEESDIAKKGLSTAGKAADAATTGDSNYSSGAETLAAVGDLLGGVASIAAAAALPIGALGAGKAAQTAAANPNTGSGGAAAGAAAGVAVDTGLGSLNLSTTTVVAGAVVAVALVSILPAIARAS